MKIENELVVPNIKNFECSKYLSPLTKFYAWVLRETYCKGEAHSILFGNMDDSELLQYYGNLGWNVSNVVVSEELGKKLEKAEIRWFAKQERVNQKYIKSSMAWLYHWLNFSPRYPSNKEEKKLIKQDKAYLLKFIRRVDV